jgi:metal-sulfur cluster biosynthetic enzyme/nitrite reductase/ring-hydroxylating ferredoxin subunit
MADFERVASIEDVPNEGRLAVVVDDIPVLLVRTGDQFYAIEDSCSHDGQPLSDGTIANGEITCTRHGARFDLSTGAAKRMPATSGVRVFTVDIRGNDIYCRESDGPVEPATLNVTATTTALPTADSGCCGGSAVTTSSTCEQHTASDEAESSGTPRSLDEKMLEALRQVIDPELMVNIVDLGLIYSVNYDGAKAYVDMTLTSPMCPAGPQLVQQSKMALERLREVDEAVIKIVMTPPWSPDRMTDEARDQLGIF